MRPGRMVEAVLGAALPPLADGLRADAEALGEDAGALLGAGDLGADGRCGAGVGMDPQHGSPPSCRCGLKALEAMSIVHDGPPDRVPTMLRDLTTNAGSVKAPEFVARDDFG